MKYTKENLIVLPVLLVSTGGLYSLVWLARVSREFGDDAVTNVILAIISFGVWAVYLQLRYLHRAEAMNGRDLAWYLPLFLLFFGWFLGPLMIQIDLNEYVDAQPAPTPAAPVPAG